MMRRIIKHWRWLCLLFLLAAMVSCLFPGGGAIWNQLLQKAGLAHFTAQLTPDRLYIHVIDVGKADAILVESPQAALLIDAATEESADDVKRYLAHREIPSLDAVWITHGDNDHAGGLQRVLEAVSAEEIVGSAYMDLPQQTRVVNAGEQLTYGDLTLEVLAPTQEYETENENSIVFRLRYGNFSMLFCGDIEAKAEKTLLNSGVDLRADVLKVAHHGSDTSNSEELLKAVQPKYAVISAGEDRNLLPRNTVLKRLRDAGTASYRTDRDGSIVICTDGENIEIITETTGRLSDGREE